jgi:pimeloyl-ACP methyl ester carboxylesterase
LIHAASPDSEVAGVISLAAHVMVEDLTLANIHAARTAYETTDLPKRLRRYHRNVDATFWGWNNIWLSETFRDWNIEGMLPSIRCPVLAIQGVGDEYGTLAQLASIRKNAPNARLLTIKDCRHSPHLDQPQAVLDAAKDFVARCGGAHTPGQPVAKRD